MREYQKYAIVLALFAAVLYASLVVAVLGVGSLLTNADVIPDPQAGPLVGPSSVGVIVVFVLVRMVLIGIRTRPENQRVMLAYSIVTGVVTWVLFLAAGATFVLFGTGDIRSATALASEMLLAPFATLAGLFAFLVSLLYSWLLAAHVGSGGRPLWPWERRGE
ncbi:DUF6121 family protein [Cryobacterium psychrophilum]|uniref:Uncharacterized protein n=1 Tax=Cryobacterium psychrophilum TaxID=41988 RepID=A0A4Y8KW32_9MICO|nr:DUF6121 family protein [Cryobacterium psychrophilum]TDW29723.1 hypothetical protein EDD25_1433 [Cryobacterium psychrophilum]TFD81830.1 hypothetical protein E3T53_02235 [Cryobacterium psychrophilum]